MKNRRPSRPCVESLELRWVPSGLGIHPAAEVSVLATKPLVLHGTLKGTIALPPATSGTQFVSLVAKGRLGAPTFALNAMVRAELLQTTGSSFVLQIGATKGGQHAVLTVQLTVTQPGTVLSYNVTSGTKFLKGSTGSGTITATLPQGAPTGPHGVPLVLTFS